jgi:hypothetical protein
LASFVALRALLKPKAESLKPGAYAYIPRIFVTVATRLIATM